jgi:hypothetical protein
MIVYWDAFEDALMDKDNVMEKSQYENCIPGINGKILVNCFSTWNAVHARLGSLLPKPQQ